LIGRKSEEIYFIISGEHLNVKMKETEIFKIKTCLPSNFLERFQEILPQFNE
jgi:hypothetical protein